MNQSRESEKHLIQHKAMPLLRRITEPEKPPCTF